MALLNFAPRSLKRTVKKTVPSAKKIQKKDKISMGELDTMIRIKAYELYEQRGCALGFDVDDWVKAETLVKSQYELNET